MISKKKCSQEKELNSNIYFRGKTFLYCDKWICNAFTLLYKEVCFYRISVVTGRHSLLSKLYCSSEDVAFMCINFLSLHRETILALLCTVEFYFSFIRFAVISL